MDFNYLVLTLFVSPLVFIALNKSYISEWKIFFEGKKFIYVAIYVTLLLAAYLFARLFLYAFTLTLIEGADNFYGSLTKYVSAIIFICDVIFWILVGKLNLLKKDNLVAKHTLYYVAEGFWLIIASLISLEVITLFS